MKAVLRNYRQSPRKVRLAADLIRGKSAAEAAAQLKFLPKRAAEPLAKLLQSAVANQPAGARLPAERLFIKEIRVDAGATLKRFRPRARGAGARINKRTSQISLTLFPQPDKK